ncbi:hypothetical protein GCM10017161_39180 [Thalassotalea marina]|uniref:Uncharacterized protein n=1 Tax=Thalassotalea marina TaxID=1673741 RepID=A0A919EPU6_9GAMM|nr:hypothetical protein GCM10017161_39180 [Thalassotalea marina]
MPINKYDTAIIQPPDSIRSLNSKPALLGFSIQYKITQLAPINGGKAKPMRILFIRGFKA